MVVRQSDSAARYGLIFSVLIIGAIIAEPVIIAVVPELRETHDDTNDNRY